MRPGAFAPYLRALLCPRGNPTRVTIPWGSSLHGGGKRGDRAGGWAGECGRWGRTGEEVVRANPGNAPTIAGGFPKGPRYSRGGWKENNFSPPMGEGRPVEMRRRGGVTELLVPEGKGPVRSMSRSKPLGNRHSKKTGRHELSPTLKRRFLARTGQHALR